MSLVLAKLAKVAAGAVENISAWSGKHLPAVPGDFYGDDGGDDGGGDDDDDGDGDDDAIITIIKKFFFDFLA